jgi:P27 family predicted phage terminase small subunit
MAANAGRKSKPAALKLVEGRGNGKDSGGREVKKPPAFKRIPPDAPPWLGELAREEWDRVIPELARLELLKQIDAAALASYCEMVELFVVATKDVHENGLTVENHSIRKDGSESTWYTANPAVGVQRNAQAAIRAWCAEFGLTPAAEMRIATSGGGDGEEDTNPFAS